MNLSIGQNITIFRGLCEKWGQPRKGSQFGKLAMYHLQCEVEDLAIWNWESSILAKCTDK
jgi:hypothetical protein